MNEVNYNFLTLLNRGSAAPRARREDLTGCKSF